MKGPIVPSPKNRKCGGSSSGITVFGFILLTTLALAIPATNAAHIPSVSSNQHGYHPEDPSIVPKKGKDKLLPAGYGTGQHGGYIPPPVPAPIPEPQPHPSVPLPSPEDDSFGIGDPYHPYSPHYDPDDHFKHYPDYRMMNDHLGDLDKIEEPGNEHRERGFKPTRPPRPSTTTASFINPIEGDDHDHAKDLPDSVTTTKTTTQRTTTSTRPDWDYVCYVLCGANQGGIACRCDILPIG